MAKFIIARAFDYTVTATGGETADMPASHLNVIQPGDIFQSPTADATLEIDLGIATPINLIGLLFTNLPVGATWEIRAAATQGGLATGTVIKAVGEVRMDGYPRHDGRSHGLWHSAAAQTFRWWRIAITGGAVAGGKLRIGRLFIGSTFEPADGHSWGSGYQIVTGTTYDRARSGAVYANVGPDTTDYSAKLLYLTPAEAWQGFYDLKYALSGNQAALVIPDLDSAYAQRELAYGFFEIGAPVYNTRLGEFSTLVKIRGLA